MTFCGRERAQKDEWKKKNIREGETDLQPERERDRKKYKVGSHVSLTL